MSIEARDRFRSQFVAIARTRSAHVHRLVDVDLEQAASELHCLSGEASMLDFGKVADLASVAEQAARDGDRSRLGALLEEMEQAVNAIERRSENP